MSPGHGLASSGDLAVGSDVVIRTQLWFLFQNAYVEEAADLYRDVRPIKQLSRGVSHLAFHCRSETAFASLPACLCRVSLSKQDVNSVAVSDCRTDFSLIQCENQSASITEAEAEVK